MQHISKLALAAPLAGIALLAACNSEPEVVGELADPDAPTANELADIELPAGERGSGIYRCADNSVVYVTFFTGDSQVGVRASREAPMMILPNAEPAEGEPEGNEADAPEGPETFTGEGYTVIGTGGTIEYGAPGGSPQTCRS